MSTIMDFHEASACLIELAHRYGGPDFARAGGGNVSVKEGATLWIKPSGTTLAGLRTGDLLAVDRSGIRAVYAIDPDEDAPAREARVSACLDAAKRDPANPRRPSVEAPLHDLLEPRFVVHTHPAFIGGLVCGRDSREACGHLFPDALAIGETDPGYRLAVRMREAVLAYRERRGSDPALIFLENHGVVVAGDTPAEIDTGYRRIMGALLDHYCRQRIPITLRVEADPPATVVERIVAGVREVAGGEAAAFAACGAFRVASGPLTPDHIVYMKAFPFIGEPSKDALEDFLHRHGYTPRIIAAPGAVVAVGRTRKEAESALELARDGALVAQLTDAFGGVRPMSDHARRFIENWEAETYRKSQSGG